MNVKSSDKAINLVFRGATHGEECENVQNMMFLGRLVLNRRFILLIIFDETSCDQNFDIESTFQML